jgi:hypothetical protein
MLLGVEFRKVIKNREALSMLTTPEHQAPDNVFPEDNWFFYWKTSPSLWRAKLESYRNTKPLVIPIYWGVHTQAPNVFDFGLSIPETDLSKLIEITSELGIRVIFGLGITPLPFLANGGLPSFLSKSLSLDRNRLGLSAVDSNGIINKMYSFYDPRVFQSYKKFLNELKDHILEKNLEVDFIGLKGYYLENNYCVSFLNDRGLAYEQGFNRFLEQKMKVGGVSISELIMSEQDERLLQKEFEKLIFDLYDESCKELFGKYWLGTLDVCFLGASMEDTIERTHDLFETASHYIHDVFQIHSLDKVPNSVLIPHQNKTDILKKSLSEINNDNFYNSKLNYDFYEGEEVANFESCTFFSIVNNFMDEDITVDRIYTLGLQSYIQSEFRWAYKVINTNFELNYDEISQHDIFFFFGEQLSQKDFSKIVKIFLGGGKVLLDRSQINGELLRKLDLFFIENQFEVEEVNYLCEIKHVRLDVEGVFVIYDGDTLTQHSLKKKIDFWERVVRYFNIKNPEVSIDTDLEFFWSKRNINSMEFNFQEIRRLSLFNPSSYRRKAKITSDKSFALRKVVDENKANVHSTPMGVDIEIAPGGSVSLDYGYIE